jgi:PAS domain S-box-containing protein
VARLRAGETLVLTDTAHDPQLTASQRAAFAAAASPAAIAVPLIKQGRLAAALTVHAATPRQWEPHEVRLAQDVAERIWAAVERVRAEEALHKLEEQFHLFVLASSDVVYKMSADWQRMLYLNGKNFLVDTTTPRSTWLESYIPPADQAAVGAAIQAAIAGKHFFELEHRVIQTDGSVGWTFSRALPVLGPQGELEGWFGTATDITPHKLAQEALRHSEAQFRAVANLVPSMLWRSDAQSETTWYNQQWLDYTGQTLEEALGYGWTEVIHPSDRAQSARRYREAVLRGQPLRQEHRIRAATGEYRWFQVQVLPYYDEQGIITQWFGAATDIHERRLAEEVLRENERRLEQQVAARVGELRASHDLLQSVFDTNLVVMSVMQAVRDEAGEVQDFRIKLVNKQMEKETGRTDLVGKLYGQEYPGVRVVGVFELMLRALATGEPQGMEHYYNHEGFAQWFSCLFVKLDDGLVVTNLDITQRKVAEQERTRNMQLLEQAESAAQLGSWEYDLATSHFHWSAGMYQLFGLPLGHPVEPSIYLDYVVAEDRALAEQLVQRLTAGAGDLEQTLRLRVGGQQKTVRIKAAGLPSGPGQPERVLGVNLDISELQRLEADNLRLRLSQQQALFEAIQAAEEQERRRMSESLHNGIGQLLYATKLQLDRLPPAAAPSPLHKAAHLLSEAIRQTRSLSHELTPAILEEFGLEATLQSICRALSTPTMHWNCHLVFDGQPALPPPLQLAVYRLAQELAQNVAKHAQASEATLEVEVLPAWVVLRVEDNGRGFDHGRTQDGLGLRSLRGRVTLLGGHVYLTTSPDQGTQCQIRLPLSPLAP